MILLHQGSELWRAWIVAASWQLALFICVIALVSRAARVASPRLRHALWLLVLVKVFLPPGLTAPWSVGRWAVPLLAVAGWSPPTAASHWLSDRPPTGAAQVPAALLGVLYSRQILAPPVLMMMGWITGGLIFLSVVGGRYARLARAIRSTPVIDEGPVRVALEQLAIELELSGTPDLHSTPLVTSPFLFGVRRPCIVLPENALTDFSEGELRAVLIHELVHFKRRDTWIGWLQVLAQSLFWFHPFLWWANSQLRRERELVCDEAVVRLAPMTPQCYGESIVRALTASCGRSLVAGTLVGVFERGVKMQNRLEDIMNFEASKRGFDYRSRLLVAGLAILLLPMAPAAVEMAVADRPYPQIVKTSPQIGATGVDPGLKEIAVTFDRDMGKGMSWTGGPPHFPPIDESRQAQWNDERTCTLPVKFEKGTFYRVGINSSSHQNFKSSEGVAALPTVIYFVTKGATAEVESKVRIPQIVSLEPKNDATDVDPRMEVLRVTFNMPMNEGMSWTGSGPAFPKVPDGKQATWSADGLTCAVPVALEPARDYQLGLNSLNHNNFQSRSGVPVPPMTYHFRTGDAKQ
jgi:beta-lactamase regulating signal transducer with metallopeptidase domain